MRAAVVVSGLSAFVATVQGAVATVQGAHTAAKEDEEPLIPSYEVPNDVTNPGKPDFGCAFNWPRQGLYNFFVTVGSDLPFVTPDGEGYLLDCGTASHAIHSVFVKAGYKPGTEGKLSKEQESNLMTKNGPYRSGKYLSRVFFNIEALDPRFNTTADPDLYHPPVDGPYPPVNPIPLPVVTVPPPPPAAPAPGGAPGAPPPGPGTPAPPGPGTPAPPGPPTVPNGSPAVKPSSVHNGKTGGGHNGKPNFRGRARKA